MKEKESKEEYEEGMIGLTEQLLKADMLTFGEQMQGLSENDLKKILIEYGTSEYYIKRILEKRRIWIKRRRKKNHNPIRQIKRRIRTEQQTKST